MVELLPTAPRLTSGRGTSKYVVTGIGLLLSGLLASGCAADTEKPESASDGRVRIGWQNIAESWVPGSDMVGQGRIAYETLVVPGSDGKVEPKLAVKWTVTDRAITFQLREGVVFHDGEKLDANAVKVALESIRDSKTQYASTLAAIESIDVKSPTEVQLNLSEPSPFLLQTLGGLSAPIASPKAIKDGTLVDQPVGTGPWAYASADSSISRMAFTYFDGYWGGRESVGPDGIDILPIPDPNSAISALRNGEIDITTVEGSDAEGIPEGSGVALTPYATLRSTVMFIDRGPGGVFEDVNVRRAVCSGIDNASMQQLGPENIEKTQYFIEGEYGHVPSLEGYSYDLNEVQSDLTKAGNPEVKFDVMGFDGSAPLLKVYAAGLAKAGITMTPQLAPAGQFFTEWNNGKYPIGIAAVDEKDPYNLYQTWFAKDGGANISGIESERLKTAADAAIAAGSSPEAQQGWEEVMRIVSEEALMCGHLVIDENIGYRENRVTGVSPITWEGSAIRYDELRLVSGQ